VNLSDVRLEGEADMGCRIVPIVSAAVDPTATPTRIPHGREIG